MAKVKKRTVLEVSLIREVEEGQKKDWSELEEKIKWELEQDLSYDEEFAVEDVTVTEEGEGVRECQYCWHCFTIDVEDRTVYVCERLEDSVSFFSECPEFTLDFNKVLGRKE